jgi:ribonuclease MRP protein subunit RMP1
VVHVSPFLCSIDQSADFLVSAFSNLTADLQYAALGMMLIGCLARARSLIRQFSNRKTSTESQTREPEATQAIPEIGLRDDLGEVLRREPFANLDAQQVESVEERPNSLEMVSTLGKYPLNPQAHIEVERASPGRSLKNSRSSTPAKKKKKKNKRGDTFDDLFSGLL